MAYRYISHWTKHNMLTIFLDSILYQVFQLANRISNLFTYHTEKRKHNYEVTITIANCLLLPTTVTLVCACVKVNSLCY